MKELRFTKSVETPVSSQRLWDWHMSEGAFERLAPAWQKLVVKRIPSRPADGETAEFELRMGPFRKKWVARLGPVEAPYRFVDTQESGPFSFWQHEHRIDDTGGDKSTLTDSIRYALPGGLNAIAPIRKLAASELSRLFAFRHRRMLDDLHRMDSGPSGSGKRVLVTGSSGLIGQRLVPYLRTLGYSVRGLSRNPRGKDTYSWDPDAGKVDPKALDGVDVVIHLAGENIAGGRWTESRKRRILESRIDGTRTLVDAMADMEKPPSVFLCASGINYYAQGGDPKNEDASNGNGFLSKVCEAWESEAMKAGEAGIRVVCIRTGIVLDPLGGALGKMLLPFRLGLGGPVGSGQQGFSWIAMDDLLDIYLAAMTGPSLDGPVNAVHPELVDQKSFSKILGRVLHRPTFLPLPAGVVKALFGQMGEETLLADHSVRPGKLLHRGHRFRFRGLEDALSFMLGK